MKPTRPARSLLAIAAGSLVAFLAAAQSGDRAAKERELQAARAQLQESARRVADLSRELGQPVEGLVVERRLLGKPVLGVLLAHAAGRSARRPEAPRTAYWALLGATGLAVAVQGYLGGSLVHGGLDHLAF